MPGHKGVPVLGAEPWDITEIEGADSLFEASGIIRESEQNASVLFGCKTFYSTEGSSLCIRAMLYLALLNAKSQGRKPVVAAGRNAHKTFLSAAALLDFDILWLYGDPKDAYLSCRITPEQAEQAIRQAKEKVTALYITSPDYLGNMADIAGLSEVCRKYGVLLLVDNAHGAYLRFLPVSCHPMDLGADLCCDSAHKTLPVLTGGAYLHISDAHLAELEPLTKQAMLLFASTSPSYLILQSLDAANRYLAEAYAPKIEAFMPQVLQLKEQLGKQGFDCIGDELLKITIDAKAYGYTGNALKDLLAEKNVICEFSDPDFLVLMLTPEIGSKGVKTILDALSSVPRRQPIAQKPPRIPMPETVLSVREAVMRLQTCIPVKAAAGRIAAMQHVGCPPAISVVVCGERIDENVQNCLAYYGITECFVVK